MSLTAWINRLDYKSAPVMWAVLGAIILSALILRIYLSDISLWVDESASVSFARAPVQLLWSDWMARETNPPLYYTFLKIWMALFGDSDLALRSLSIIAGCTSIFIAFLIARDIGGPLAGLLAALLLAISFQNIFYSLQVRGYIFTQTFALAALYAVLRIMRPDEPQLLRRWALGVYVVSVSAAAYCHTTLIILPVLINLFLIPWAVKQWPVNRIVVIEWALAQAIVLILWSWWGGITLQQMNHAATINWIPQLNLSEAVGMIRKVYAPNFQSVAPGGKFWAAVLIGLAVYMAVKYRARPALILPLVGLAVPILIFLLNLKTPIMLPRTLYWGTGPFIAAVAIGICALPDHRAAIAAAILAITTTGLETVSQRHQYQMEPWQHITEVLSQRNPTAVVLTSYELQGHLMQRYCAEINCRLTILVPRTDPGTTSYLPLHNQVNLAQVPALLSKYSTLYVISRRSKNLNGLLTPHGTSRPVAIDGLPEIIAVTEWTAAARPIRSNE